MTTEELMRPRVMCIGTPNGTPNDTSGNYISGDVLTETTLDGHKGYSNNGDFIPSADIEDFPHLFQSIPWWESRTPEDMPEYVKDIIRPGMMDEAYVWKVKTHYFQTPRVLGPRKVWEDSNEFIHSYMHYEPATEEEYLDYIIKKHDAQMKKETLKVCPVCGSTDVVTFDADNDLCRKCDRWFPAL